MALKRTEFKRQPAKEPKPKPGPRQRKCKCCGASFVPFGIQSWCGPECGYKLSQVAVAKKKAKEKMQERAIDKAKREDLKNRYELIAEAQKWFNTVVRLEDADLPCISCGKIIVDDGRPGGVWDAGHLLTRGSSPHLRFDRRNVHKQCKGCNRPGGTTRAAHRAGVEARIGLEALEALESDQDSRDYTKDDLRMIRDTNRKLAAQLKKQRS